MQSIRRLVRDHRAPIWLLLALTLAVRLVVPAGFMPSITAAGGVAITLCDGMAAPMPHAMAARHGDHGTPTPAKPDQPCAFAGLAAPGLGGADPIQLALAIAAIVALGLVLRRQLPRLTALRDRPPLRGPPLHA